MTESSSVPAQIGKYKIVKELGHGGMGVVYLADHPTFRRQCAIKMLLPDAARYPNARARFLREAQALAIIHSDHVLTIYDVVDEGDSPYYVMELLSGYSLAELIRKGPQLQIDQIIDLGLDFAKGLADAHAEGVIHRDIKPGNLFIEQPKNRGKILDFGLTRLRETTELTAEQTLMGTLLYMPLEQAKREPVDHRADIYSLGVVLYQLVTGWLPFQGQTEYEVLYALSMEEAPRIEMIVPETPPRLAQLIHKMLEKDRDKRPQTMHEVVDELDVIRGTRSAAKFPVVPTQVQFPPITPTVVPAAVTKGPLASPFAPTVTYQPKARGSKLPLMFIVIILLAIFGFGVKKFVIDAHRAGESLGSMEFAKKSPDEPDLLDCTGANGVSPDVVKKNQQAWADYLKMPVETSVDLGNGVSIEFVLIPPGKFWMGTSDEEHQAILKSLAPGEMKPESLGWDQPRHPVTISRPFYVSKGEVTQQEYLQLTGLKNPSRFHIDPKPKSKTAHEPLPVDKVSWDDAYHAAEKLTSLPLPRGFGKATLLTEAQWEYACRAGTVTPFHYGEALDGQLANCDGKFPFGSQVIRPFVGKTIDIFGSPTTACGTQPNAFGLYQMHGNVLEWCLDGFDEHAYSRHKPVDPQIGPGGKQHVLRGGAWSSPARACRSAERFRNDRSEKKDVYGFRLALVE